MRKRAHVLVSGSVQGVNFRWYTTQHARRLGVGGWIRNTPDGRVEAVFEGDAQPVEELVEWCRQGPRHARVTSVDVNWEEPEGLYEFDVEF
ncbi:MAG TPA: acylphosphatase [Actinomycetota bacterium]|jgi:acylphosphatase|nr:acylphosphatase [Actinomycetota bacterium]